MRHLRIVANLILRRANRAARRKPARRDHRMALAPEPLEQRLLMFSPHGAWDHTALTYSFSNLLDGGLPGVPAGSSDFFSAVEEGMGVWSAVTPLTFTFDEI